MDELKMNSKPWWQTDEYDGDADIPQDLRSASGPEDVALVSAFEDGTTTSGWGLNPRKKNARGFMDNYAAGKFLPERVLNKSHYRKGGAFAFVMRSMSVVCIDIDGKNGGLEGALALGVLPETLAETSKSGTGYHLFYSVPDTWNPDSGFGLLSDRIGIAPGVDFRATGCVFHYSQQRWNSRAMVDLPKHLMDMLVQKEQKMASASERIQKVLDSEDEIELAMLHDELINDLHKPIPSGRRNNTLFAIGNKMREAQVENWEELVHERAFKVGLGNQEAFKLVDNIKAYGPSA